MVPTCIEMLNKHIVVLSKQSSIQDTVFSMSTSMFDYVYYVITLLQIILE
jgi:hypothetical protein